MDLFIKISLFIHVFAGSSAILTGLIAILLKGNTPRHKKAGIIYFWCMTVIFVTGTYLSVFRNNIFLLCISVFSYYACLSAYRILKHKSFKGASKADWLIEGTGLISFLGLITLGILALINNEDKFIALIPFTFGLIGLRGVQQKVKLYLKGPQEKLFWLKFHIGNMIGSYIAAITAFLVNQSEHIPVHQTILWLGPTVLFVPVIMFEIKKVKTIPVK